METRANISISHWPFYLYFGNSLGQLDLKKRRIDNRLNRQRTIGPKLSQMHDRRLPFPASGNSFTNKVYPSVRGATPRKKKFHYFDNLCLFADQTHKELAVHRRTLS